METTAQSPAMPKGNNQDSTASSVDKVAAAVHHAIDKAADTVVTKIRWSPKLQRVRTAASTRSPVPLPRPQVGWAMLPAS